MRHGLNFDRRSFAAGTTLAQLASAGAKEPALASVVLETVINELSQQSKYVLSLPFPIYV